MEGIQDEQDSYDDSYNTGDEIQRQANDLVRTTRSLGIQPHVLKYRSPALSTPGWT